MAWPEIPSVVDLPTAPQRIILHWTAGGHNASSFDREHYHYLVTGQDEPQVVPGVEVAANMRQLGNSSIGYAAHTRGMNSFSVGVSACGMLGAIQGKTFGDFPIKEGQVKEMCRFVAACCQVWGLPVTQDTVFTHEEAQRLHGVPQRAKWDISVLPWMPDLTPEQVGQWLRAQVAEAEGVGP